jgi:hypothetical protein
MFPDRRLTAAAFLASVIGISCGLGLFAAFRVNREPFAQVANGAAPLQLVLAAPASIVAADRTDRLGVPFGIRFQVNATAPAPAPAVPEPAAPAAQNTPAAVALVSPPNQAPPPDTKPVAQQVRSATHHRVATRRLYKRQTATAAQPDGQSSQFAQPASIVPGIRQGPAPGLTETATAGSLAA